MFPFPRLIQFLSIFVLGILLSIECHLPTWGQSPATLYESATLKWQEGQTTTAIALWQQVIENTPHQNLKGRAYLMLAQAYLELGFIHQASQAWEQGNLLSSPFPTLTPFAKGIEGNLALAKGDFEQAIAAYQQVPENLIALPLAKSVAITLNHPVLLAQVERLSAQELEKEGHYEKALERTLRA